MHSIGVGGGLWKILTWKQMVRFLPHLVRNPGTLFLLIW